MKKILCIGPVVVRTSIDEMVARHMEEYLAPGFELHHRNVQYGGVESIGGLYYTAVTVPYIVDEILKAERDGYDAVIVDCGADPGVAEGRELVRIPIVGAGEAAYYLALILADRVGIIDAGGTYRTPSHSALLYDMRRQIRIKGLSDRIVSIRVVGSAAEDFEDLTVDAFYTVALKCIEDGAEAIILACTGMTGYVQELQEKLDVPVVDPIIAALKFAEALITMNLTHSKLTIPAPSLVGAKCEMKYPPTLMGYHG